MTVAVLGSVSFGVAVPVGVCVGALQLPVCLVSPGRGLVWRPAVVACWAGWATGLGGGAAGWGVRRVVLCGALGSWGDVGAAGVGAPALVGWRGCVCVQGWALGDVPQADTVSLRLLEGFPQALEDIRVVLGHGEVAGVDSQGVERIGQHGFTCGLRHPPPRRLKAAVLHRPLAGRWTRPSREGSVRTHFRSSQSCVWVQRCHHCPWAGLPSWAEEWAWVGVMGSWGLVAVPGLGDSS